MPVTDQGYVVDTTREIVDSMAADALVKYEGNDIDTSDNSVLGILLGLVALQVNQQSQAISELYNGQDPDTAEGKSLDNLAYRNGIIRKGSAPSTALVTFTNNTGNEQVLLAGTAVESTRGDTFTTDVDITLATSLGSTGTVEVTSTEDGAIEAPANTITDYPGGGDLVLVTNPEAASVGYDVESDDALRIRLKRFLQTGGNSTEQAIASAVSNIFGVTDVAVVENDSLEPVSRGLNRADRPSKSFEVVVEGGSDTEIAEAIALSKPVGITSFGDTIISNPDPVAFVGLTRPEVYNIKVNLSYEVYLEESLPNGIEGILKDNAVAFGADEYSLGKDVIAHRLSCAAADGVSGIGAVFASVSIDGVDYTNDRIVMEVFQKAKLLSENITVERRIDFN